MRRVRAFWEYVSRFCHWMRTDLRDWMRVNRHRVGHYGLAAVHAAVSAIWAAQGGSVEAIGGVLIAAIYFWMGHAR